MDLWSNKYKGFIASVGFSFPEEGFLNLKSTNGCNLVTYRFHHDHPKALVFLFHGMHMSSYDFSHVGQELHDSNFAVAAFDQENHGKSGGDPGTVKSLDDYCTNCENFIIKTKELYPEETPVFCLGLSMGGSLCVMLALKRPDLINGIILLGASLAVDPSFEPALQKIVRFLNFCCCGALRLKAIDHSIVSRNPHYPGYFEENPEYFSGKLNVKTGAAVLKGFQKLQTQLPNFDKPVLMFHGEQDKLASCDQAKEFIRICKSKDKELVVYPDMYHVVTHEPEYPEIMQKTLQWLNQRV